MLFYRVIFLTFVCFNFSRGVFLSSKKEQNNWSTYNPLWFMKMQEFPNFPNTFQCWGENFRLECNNHYNMDLVGYVQFNLWSSETSWGLLQLEVKEDPWPFFLCSERKKSNYHHFYGSLTEFLNSVGPSMNSWCTPLVTGFHVMDDKCLILKVSQFPGHLTAHLSKLHFAGLSARLRAWSGMICTFVPDYSWSPSCPLYV